MPICRIYAWISKTMRTYDILVIFPYALFTDLGPFGQVMIYHHLDNVTLFQCVPVYMHLHSSRALILLVENDLFSHLKSRT